MEWLCIAFEDLTVGQLYDMGQLRQAVFVVEQQCPYLDFDGKDRYAWHILGYEGRQLVACARILPAGVSYPADASVGRVVSSSAVRGGGIGKALMREVMHWAAVHCPGVHIRISAQSYLEDFYAQYGFVQTGKKYLEDDIPHTEMLYKL